MSPDDMALESMKVEFCNILKKINALEFGTFRLTGGKITPYYVDLRLIPSFPDAFRKVCDFSVDLIVREIGAENFDRVAGIPTAGITFASFIAYRLGKPFLYIRQRVRRSGRERRVEGVLMPGEKVLLVDDLITTGLTLQKAASIVGSEGGVVSDAFVLLDRMEGGSERLAKDGIRLHSLTTIDEIAKKLYEMDAITEDQMRTILSQIRTK
ncbi:MAG: orotate phosphoribosyltransferase [Candidatus Bathyarchaeota archaeon B26-2]|nr:MAG: orotate phosphoribosyltransferase [Candidatus Bathyarchaeota archaeon B26-2]